MLYHYKVIFDGGSKNNGSPDAEAYGSYHISTASGKWRIARLEFDQGMTNTVAEYRSLISALDDVIETIETAGFSADKYNIHVIGDSQVVLYQVNWAQDDLPKWNVNEHHLLVHRDAVRDRLRKFKGHKLEWTRREEIVGVLGH